MPIDSTLADLAHSKAQSAREKVDEAEAELKSANQTLEKAIPRGNVGEIKTAHKRTQKAEVAVVEAGHELDVVEVLLDSARGDGQVVPSTARSAP